MVSVYSTSHCDSLVRDALSDMSVLTDSGQDCWLSWVRKLEQLFNIPSISNYVKKTAADKIIKKRIKSIFDRFWLDEINLEKLLMDTTPINCVSIQP